MASAKSHAARRAEEDCESALAKLSIRELESLRALHQHGETSRLHEQLKQLLGMKKMGERARAIGVLLRMQEGNCGGSDEETELVLEGNELDVSKGEDDALIVEPNGGVEPQQITSKPLPKLVSRVKAMRWATSSQALSRCGMPRSKANPVSRILISMSSKA